MAIPHWVILHTVLNVVASVTAVVAWISILATGKLPPQIAAFHATRLAVIFTGRWPAGLFRLSAGWVRVDARLWAYSMLLTDEYPPFSID